MNSTRFLIVIIFLNLIMGLSYTIYTSPTSFDIDEFMGITTITADADGDMSTSGVSEEGYTLSEFDQPSIFNVFSFGNIMWNTFRLSIPFSIILTTSYNSYIELMIMIMIEIFRAILSMLGAIEVFKIIWSKKTD